MRAVLLSVLLSVPVLSIGLALFSALVGVSLIPAESFGSCFEGGCGYMALFIVAPLTTLGLLPLFWLLVRRLGPLSRIILWLPVTVVLGTLLWGPLVGVVIAPVLLVVAAVMAIRQHRAREEPMRELFLQTGCRVLQNQPEH